MKALGTTLALRPLKSLTSRQKEEQPVSVTVLPTGESLVVSRLRDHVWDFYPYIEQENVPPNAKRAPWRAELPDGSLLTDPKNADLLAAAQDFVWSLFAEPIRGRKRLKHRTLIAKVGDVTALIRWMVGLGIYRFRDLDSVIASYPAAARTGADGHALSDQQVTRRLGIVEDLYHQRDKLDDALTVHPWPAETAGSLSGRGRRGARRDKPKTPYIPDDVAIALARAALELVQVRAPTLLALRDEMEQVRSAADRNGASAREQDREKTAIARAAGFSGQRAVAAELKRLRTACYIAIDLFCGIRDSEMMSLAVNCVAQGKSNDGTVDVLRLHGTIYKTGKRPHAWIVPLPVQQAVAVLERLAAPLLAELREEERQLMREARNTKANATRLKQLHRRLVELRRSKDKLFVAHGPAKGAPIAVLSGNAMNAHLKAFCAHFGIVDASGRSYRLRTHQFRRTYARYVARNELGDLLTLQRHFGHWSFDMTAYYADGGADEYEVDTDLIAMVVEEKTTRQNEILATYLDSEDPIANGGHWLYEWRKNVRTAKSKEALIAQYASTITLNGTGHSWCVGNVKGTGCGGLCVFEAEMCVDCRYGVIGPEHRPVWQGIKEQQTEAIALGDIGPGGTARAQKILFHANKVLDRLDRKEPAL